MWVGIQADDGRDGEIVTRELLSWLRREEGLRGRVAASAPVPADTCMGSGLLEVVTVAVGAQGAGTVLAGSVVAWLRQRRGDVTIKVTRSADEFSLVVDAKRLKDPDALVRTLQDFVDAAGPAENRADGDGAA